MSTKRRLLYCPKTQLIFPSDFPRLKLLAVYRCQLLHPVLLQRTHVKDFLKISSSFNSLLNSAPIAVCN